MSSETPQGQIPTVQPSTADLAPEMRHAHLPIGERPGDSIGPYRLLSVLGEGGFGVVFLAERREPFVQRVALKVIKPGMDSKAVVARFEQERQALAVMDHPNVAKVLDGGVTPSGRPFFVMEHVQGEPITDYCDRQRYTIRQRLELFIPVCEAVQHAHMKGIIHRDLKPSNILVSVKDGAAIPKVIDFGVAKAISHTLTEKTIFTEQGMLIGTPEYMSPEQAEMGATDIDTRTDVYSLGVVLYELLSGVRPFDAGDLRRAGHDAIRQIIREVDAPRPSTRLTSLGPESGAIAKRRQARLEELARELRRELEWIPLCCLRKDRTRRYATCNDIAADLRRYLKHEALQAGPESRLYRIRKLVSANGGALAWSFVLLAGLCGALGAALALSGRSANETNAWHYVVADLEGAVRARAASAAAQLRDVPRDLAAAARHPGIGLAIAELRSADPSLATVSDEEALWQLLLPAQSAKALQAAEAAGTEPLDEGTRLARGLSLEERSALVRGVSDEQWRQALAGVAERLEHAAAIRSATARGVAPWLAHSYSDRIHVPTNAGFAAALRDLNYVIGGYDADTGLPLPLGRVAELRGLAEAKAYPHVGSRFRERYSRRLVLPAMALLAAGVFMHTRRPIAGELAVVALAASLALVGRTAAGVLIWHFDAIDAMIWMAAFGVLMLSAVPLGLSHKRWAATLAAAALAGWGAAGARYAVDVSDSPRWMERASRQI